MRRNTFTRPALATAVLLLSISTIGAFGVADHASAQSPDPFSVVRAPEQASATYVGSLPGGIRVALVLPTSGDAVGYLCDGTGLVSSWFSGTFDRKTGVVSLTAKDGATIRFTTATRKGVVTRRGTPSSLTLEPALGTAGLYRKIVKDARGDAVLGWIAGNDRVIVGTGSLGAVPVVSLVDGTSQTQTTPKVVTAPNVGLTDAFVGKITEAMLDGPVYIKIGDLVVKPR